MNRRRLFKLAAALGTVGLTAACSDAVGDKPVNSATEWNKGRLAIGTGGTSGVYYQFGGALADAINASLPGAVATAQPTGASIDNIRRLARGDAAMCLSGDGVPADALAGTGEFSDQKQQILSLASVFPGILHLVCRDDIGTDPLTGAPRQKVKDVEGLRGLRVARGNKASGDDLFSRRVLEAAGLKIESDIVSQNISVNAAIEKMKMPRSSADAIDAFFASSGVPNTPIQALLATGGYHLVPMGQVAEKLANEYGGYRQTTIKGKEYKVEDVASVEAPTLLLVRQDMPEQLAYDICKALFDHQKDIGALVPVVNDLTKSNASNTKPVPLHKGAERYFAENPQ
ncbi:C4-dicarboxylate ABC transporter substrate-binding protein [Actinorhabdospora filicis]|uniref:C4-dicarboxylate ABC transporter substrate-binding protein n=1 Tax=Actinorhabdospora filicis TaxID=1785913 RepID=A0A9W6SH39_9ACTN|nr:TAXI family TRAP transporter solute-binding subunit [Actinorhabdospora filicis]GLZ76158.1 C4-dicarboxylate ABC transporter substrate-binding protein [Actinorhabdospora filicis]